MESGGLVCRFLQFLDFGGGFHILVVLCFERVLLCEFVLESAEFLFDSVPLLGRLAVLYVEVEHFGCEVAFALCEVVPAVPCRNEGLFLFEQGFIFRYAGRDFLFLCERGGRAVDNEAL